MPVDQQNAGCSFAGFGSECLWTFRVRPESGESRSAGRASIDWGYVGDVRLVRMGGLELLLQAGVVPVISPITHDGKGVLLNSNADGIAAAGAETLGMCYDVELSIVLIKRGC